jgi:hypothetical protein
MASPSCDSTEYRVGAVRAGGRILRGKLRDVLIELADAQIATTSRAREPRALAGESPP